MSLDTEGISEASSMRVVSISHSHLQREKSNVVRADTQSKRFCTTGAIDHGGLALVVSSLAVVFGVAPSTVNAARTPGEIVKYDFGEAAGSVVADTSSNGVAARSDDRGSPSTSPGSRAV